MVLYYCEKCGTRVDPEDLQAGSARLIDESRAVCLACCSQERALGAVVVVESETEVMRGEEPRPDSKIQRTPHNVPASTARANAVGSAVRRATAPVRTPASKIASAVEAPATPNKWVAFALGAGVVLLGVAIALLRPFGGTDEPKNETVAEKEPLKAETATKTPALPTQPDPLQPTPPPEHLDARGKEAHVLLEDARIFALKNPTDSHAYAAKLEQIFNAFRATPAGQEAQNLLQKIRYPDPQTQLAPENAWSSAVNLTALIDTTKDIVKGKWKKEGSKLIVEPEAVARIHVPYEPPEEYDVRILFSRVSGEEDVNLMFAAYGKALMWSMAPSRNSCMGFECINGKDAQSSPEAIRVKPALESNKLYTCVVQVRSRVIRAYLNGKCVKEYRTNYNEFSMRNDWKLKNERILGLGGHNSRIVFDKVELRAVTGSGKTIR